MATIVVSSGVMSTALSTSRKAVSSVSGRSKSTST